MNSTSTIAHQKTEQTENIESRIIEAAKQEFIKKGFEQTSMSDIAAVVGINRPTLHYYFRTKDKMFQAVFASIVAKFLPHIDTIFSTQQSFSEKLEDVIDVYIHFLDKSFAPQIHHRRNSTRRQPFNRNFL